MTYPRNSGDLMLFHEQFTNYLTVAENGGVYLAGTIDHGLLQGQVYYRMPAYESVRWAGSFTVFARVTLEVNGDDQALVSLGSATAWLELGVDATGQPYAWGTAQVVLGSAIPDGDHQIAFTVTSAGEVAVYVDGELWGGGTVTLGASLPTEMRLGGRYDGDATWWDTIYDLRIYRRAFEHDEVAHEMGVDDYWTPAVLAVGYDWFWMDLRAANAFTYATQPSWTLDEFSFDAGWVLGAGWSISGGYATHAAGVGSSMYRAGVTSGTRVAATYSISSTNGSVVLIFGGNGVGTSRNVAGVYDEEHTAGVNTNVVLNVSSAFVTSSVDYIRNLRCISVAAVAVKGTLGNLTQGTPSAMGYNVSPGNSMRFNTSDYLPGAGAASGFTFLHDGSPFTTWIVFTADPLGATTALYSTSNGLANGIGQFVYYNAAGAVRMAIGNGVAYTFDQSAAAVVSGGNKYIFIARYSGSGDVELWVNGVRRLNAPLVNAPSPNPPTGFVINSLNAAGVVYSSNITYDDAGAIAKGVNDTELDHLGQYLAARYAGTWA